MKTEFLNRVELTGIVGKEVKIFVVHDMKVARFTLMTTDGEKAPAEWHNVSVWEGEGVDDFSKLKKGDWVHLVGRSRSVAYVDQSGVERILYEVRAQQLEILK